MFCFSSGNFAAKPQKGKSCSEIEMGGRAIVRCV